MTVETVEIHLLHCVGVRHTEDFIKLLPKGCAGRADRVIEGVEASCNFPS